MAPAAIWIGEAPTAGSPPLTSPLSAAESALVSTIFDPPRARRPWRLGDVLPAGTAAYYSLGRWALVQALRVSGVGAGDRVLIPGLVCRDVLASVRAVGAEADFYPVLPGLRAEALEPATGARAILAVNYFGFPQDLRPFRDYCARTGAALIEDNAHGLFSRDHDGAWLGGRGDAGIFSFRKTIPLSGGGAVVSHRGTLPDGLPPVRRLALRYRAKQVARRVAGRLAPVHAMDAIGAVRRLRQWAGGGATRSDRAAEFEMPCGPNPPAAIMEALVVADPELECNRRRALYLLVHRILDRTDAAPVFPDLPDHVVPYGFPLLAPRGQVAMISAHLARHGLPLVRWPDLPSAIAPAAPDHYRNLMIVPFLW